jgi:hypothetical protein
VLRIDQLIFLQPLTIIVTLGAAIGVPLQAPDRGMVPAVVILLVAVVYQRGLNFWTFKSRRAEVTLQGDVSVMVKDGLLELPSMKSVVLSKERLFSVLRQEGLVHLGQVKRAYLEADGRFSIYQNQEPPPGLCLIPAGDKDLFEKQFLVPDQYACRNCGHVVRDGRRSPDACSRCGFQCWSPAVQCTNLAELRPDGQPSKRARPSNGAAHRDERSPSTPSNEDQPDDLKSRIAPS